MSIVLVGRAKCWPRLAAEMLALTRWREGGEWLFVVWVGPISCGQVALSTSLVDPKPRSRHYVFKVYFLYGEVFEELFYSRLDGIKEGVGTFSRFLAGQEWTATNSGDSHFFFKSCWRDISLSPPTSVSNEAPVGSRRNGKKWLYHARNIRAQTCI